MRRPKWPALAAIAGCAVVVLAGCGTQTASSSGGVSLMTATATAPAASVASALSPARRAAADATGMLGRFRPPPAAIRTGRLPVSSLAQAPTSPMSADLVTRTAWWREAGQQVQVLTWLLTHPPSGMTMFSTGGFLYKNKRVQINVPPPGMSFPDDKYIEFSLPSVPDGQLLVAVASDGDGHVAIRVDAQVVWLPVKPAAERIPSAATTVTITSLPGYGSVSAVDQPVTITDPAKVRKIAAVIDALPVFPPGIMSCPAFQGRAMQLTFRASPAGPALAVVTGDTSGCGSVAVTIDGRAMAELAGSMSMQQQVMAIAGIHWPGFPTG